MGETALIQNTAENYRSEVVTDSSVVLQSEVTSEADGTDEVLTSITNVCRQVLESHMHLTLKITTSCYKYIMN